MDGIEAVHGEGGASDKEVNDVMRVQWTTSHARMERWVEEVELLQEEMRRVVGFLEWKSENWFAKKDIRSTTTPSGIRSGLQAYARKQAAIYHDLAVLFSRLWRPTLVSYNLKHSWITEYMERHKIPLSDTNVLTSRARGIFKARVLNETDSGSSQVGITPHVQLQDSFDITMDDNTTLLEEVTHVNDNEDEGNYTEAWNSPHHSDSDSNNDNDDNDSDDLDFDFDFD